MKNRDVVEKWKEGEQAQSGSLFTNGRDVWSYGFRIGMTQADGTKVGFDATAKGGHFLSTHTSQHVGLVRAVASRMVPVPKSKRWGK